VRQSLPAVRSPRNGRAATVVLCGALLLGSAAGCRLLTRSRSVPHVRGVVLVLAAGLSGGTDAESAPVFAELRAAGRSFDGALAPDPRPAAARAALLGAGETSLPARFRGHGGATAGVGSALALPVEDSVWDVHLPGPVDGPGVLNRVETWLRSQQREFLLVVSVGGEPRSRPGQRQVVPVAGAFAPPLPLIAVRDLGFGERPGSVIRPPAWSEGSQRRAKVDQLERSLTADQELGRLLEVVHRASPASAVVVVGDPAPDLGAHGVLARPDALFDDTLRCVLVVVVPGASAPGRPSERLVSTLDLGPTVLDLVGFPIPPGLEGRSLAPLLADATGTGRQEVLASVPRRAGRLGRSARSARWRYTEWPDGSRELYDHDEDPAELVNLAPRPESRATIEALGRAFETPSPDAGSSSPTPRARPHSVLLIIVDDLTTRVGAWGAPVQTPNIDRLAARGVRFDHAYVQVAMCSPSRTSMLTGWRPERTGVWQNFDPDRPRGATPLQEYFAAHGARTAGVGKIYHYPRSFRWTVPAARPTDAEEESTDEEPPVTKLKNRFARPATGTDLDQPDGKRARRGAELLEALRDRFFFVAVGLVRPHREWIAPARYFDLYPPASVTLPPFVSGDLADVPAIAVKTKAQPLPGLPLLGREPAGLIRDAGQLRDAISAYEACTTFADAQVGVLLRTLDRLDLWKSTVVVLVGDNGFHLGEHGGLLRKDTLFEEALHVPLVIAAPDLPHPGAVVSAPVEVLDLYPTVTELAGLPPVTDLDGVSLVRLLASPDAAGRGPAVSYRRVQPTNRGVSIRTPSLRYTLWPDGSEELYDYRTSGADSENLADRPDRADEKARLRARLVALLAESHGGR
jgi:iduronate 2-sulfatase